MSKHPTNYGAASVAANRSQAVRLLHPLTGVQEGRKRCPTVRV